jgi:LEA14-like dessication related protein
MIESDSGPKPLGREHLRSSGTPTPGVFRHGVTRPLAVLAMLLAILATVPACGLLVRSPQVAIVDVRVVGLGISGGTAEILLQVDNPNRFNLEVREFSYLLEVADPSRPEQWDTLAVGVTADTLQLDRRATSVVPLLVPFRYSALGTALRAWMQGGEIPYRLEGEVRARGAGFQRDLPFRSRGALTP